MEIRNIIDVVNKELTRKEAEQMAIMHKGEMFTFFDEGNTRHVFVNKDKTKVIKLLKIEAGFDYNHDEANIYMNASQEDKDKMASTELVNGVIEQEFVMPMKWAGKKLTIPQMMFASSCRNEVGFRSTGELVCFDLDEFKKY